MNRQVVLTVTLHVLLTARLNVDLRLVQLLAQKLLNV
jgi:hypothetical protein